MTFIDNYSITRSFATKKVDIIIDNSQKVTINLPTVNIILTEEQWNIFYNILSLEDEKLKELMVLGGEDCNNTFDVVKLMLFRLSKYIQYFHIASAIQQSLLKLIDNLTIDTKNQRFLIGDFEITRDVWDYIIYILKLSYGEKVTQPLTFENEAARKFYEKQKALDKIIEKTRAKAQDKSKNDKESLGKICISIMYSFPSFTIDYLYNQTLAQIQWLQSYAAGAVSYEVNAKAFAAGNMKKGSKLEFFIK